MKRQEVVVWCRLGHTTVDAVVLGLWAVHRTVPEDSPRGWAVTHLPTGMRHPDTFSTQAKALAVAGRLKAQRGWHFAVCPAPGTPEWAKLALKYRRAVMAACS